jgi:uncharacterized membrane protein
MALSDIITQNVMYALYIIIGFIIMYVGYAELNHYSISQFMALILINMGINTIIYGGYQMYSGYQ